MNAMPFDFSEIVLPLVEWYRSGCRDLPWRHTADPYRIWVSEIMLQQTRVEAVKPYYARFLERFPDAETLAEAPEEELFKLWEGLGYYSRARNLLAAARRISEAGGFPEDEHGIRSLKGVGPYTAAAIGSIAFGLPLAVVDGNVLRVVSRLCCLEEDISEPRVRGEIFSLLSVAMPQGRKALETDLPTPFGLPRNDAGDFNQAMMELGACVCVPNGEPLCDRCPLAGLCRAHLAGRPEAFPLRATKRPRRIEERTVFLVWSDGRIALRKRPDSGLLAGLWEFPSEPGTWEREEASARWGAPAVPVGRAKHVFTHVEWKMTGYEIHLPAVPADQERLLFVTPREMEQNFALPSALETFRKLVLREDGSRESAHPAE